MDEYDGRLFDGIDLHRQRSVIVRQTDADELITIDVFNTTQAAGTAPRPVASCQDAREF